MKEHKNIERLFQEKFKDFEVSPPEDSWSIIASKIQEKKKKRRVFPIWLKASGIAASFFLILFLVINYNSSKNNILLQDNEKVVFDKTKEKNNKTTIENKNENIYQKSETIVSKDNNTVEESTEAYKEVDFQGKSVKNKTNKTIVSSDKNYVSHEKNSKAKRFDTKNNEEENTLIQKTKKDTPFLNSKETVVLSKVEETNLSLDNNKENSINYNPNQVTQNNSKTNSSENSSLNVFDKISNKENKNSVITNKNIVDFTNKTIVASELENLNDNTQVVKDKTSIENNSLEKNSVVKRDNLFQSTTTAVAEANLGNKNQIQKKDNIIKDSTMVATDVIAEVNALEQLLKEKEEGKNADEKEKEKRSKWVISSNAAPVYFNSISNGSPIDEQFTSNEKSYAKTLSYGLGLQYEITNKVSIRSGINAININYNTNNIYYSSTLGQVNSSGLNIAKNGNAQNLVLRSSPSPQEVSSLSADVENITQSNQASLNQEMGYIEVPLELSYKILDKKIGIEFIGGMSTLFLNKNNISLVSNGSEMEIGEANNLNNIHFSSNVGLGFNYNFLKSFQFNVQPVFKYQINTFNSGSGNFKPYIIGLYSGISFKF
ncbi:hypothetical protein [Flavobacterium sp. J27]|uniref:hypothetical protein n=1 Tax=Flavobacterium sp. J27 TaxID=2060419 RepID=UPI00102F9111|nr:hypothetical protein [Flavobacterium sp. J27]